jgi:hypothetical protein
MHRPRKYHCGCQELGEEVNKELFNEHKVWVCKMKKNSELDKSDDYTAIWMYLIPFKNG